MHPNEPTSRSIRGCGTRFLPGRFGRIPALLLQVLSVFMFAALHSQASQLVCAVNAGGVASGAFQSDAFFSGGSTYSNGSAINTTGVTSPAPQSVYQTERFGNFSYTFTGLAPGGSHLVRLHFAENYHSTAGSRVFNVAMNGTAVLSNYDIFADAGSANKAVVKEFIRPSDASGQIVIQFSSLVDNAKVGGIEIHSLDAASPFCMNVDIDRGSTYSGMGAAPDAGTRWNMLAVTSTGPVTPVMWSNLYNSQNSATTCGVTIVSSSGAISSSNNTTTGNGNPNPSAVMADFLRNNNYTVTITGLAQGNYLLYAYAHGSSAANSSTVTVSAANGGGSASTGTTGTTYRNIFAAGAEGNSYVRLPAAVGTAGTLTFNANPYLNGFQIIEYPKAAITLQPPTTASVQEHGSLTLTAAATGEGALTYQWRKGGVNLSDGATVSGSSISGATTSTLSLSNTRPSDTGNYELVVTNPGGSITSNLCAVTVMPSSEPLWMAQPDGYAADVTGGAGGAEVTVTTSAELLQYATSPLPYVIHVSGTIDVTGGTGGDGKNVGVLSNKTIEGIGTDATIIGCLHLGTPGCQNVIIRRLNITHPGSIVDPLTGKYADGGDGISVWSAKRVFVTQCTFYDCGDGSCDITHEADYVTVSWCKFQYASTALLHRLTMILGNMDPTPDSTNPGYHTTIHHNWWAENCDQRMPSGSFSAAHIYNNYFSCTGNYYCSNARVDSQWLVQNNYYKQVRSPVTKQDGGKIFLSGNIADNCSDNPPGYDSTVGAVTPNDDVVLPAYNYGLHNAADVPSIVMAGAGAAGAPPSSIQTIGFAVLPLKSLADGPFTLTATATSGLPVTFASSDASVAVVSGNTVTIAGPGTAIITASQYGNATFAPAASVQQALVVLDAEAAWALGFGLDPASNGASMADPDHDGMPNVLEFFLGRNPTMSEPGGALNITPGNGVFTVSFRRSKAAAQLAFRVEYASSLEGPWQTAVHGTDGVTIESIPADANSDLIRVTMPASASSGFCRLAL